MDLERGRHGTTYPDITSDQISRRPNIHEPGNLLSMYVRMRLKPNAPVTKSGGVIS